MIDAFALFSKTHPDHCLDIYGEGPMRQELEEYIERKDVVSGYKAGLLT